MRCQRGLALAAERLAGEDPYAVCATFARWRDDGRHEMTWLAGPGLDALGRAGVQVPSDPAVRTVKRFLVGAETDAEHVLDAVDRCVAAAGDEGPPLPPDVRGALVDATDRFFDLLAEAYGAIHDAVRHDDSPAVDRAADRWRVELDGAAADIDDRAAVLLGLRPTAASAAGNARSVADHPGLAVAFVALAIVAAAVVMWLVLHGWPAQTPRFGS